MQSATHKHQFERAELETLLASGILGRTNNLVRLLSFVCEKHFDDAVDEIKEYSIAVQALGRPPDFDPQIDTIVRVTAHALRKRLEDYYRTAGAQHSVHICLPPGHYLPKFVHKSENERVSPSGESTVFEPATGGSHQESGFSPGLVPTTQKPALPQNGAHAGEPELRRPALPRRRLATAAILIVAAAALTAFLWRRSDRENINKNTGTTLPGAYTASTSGPALHVTAGDGRSLYVDHAGVSWETDRFCSGGSSFAVTGHIIQGTEDQQLFSAGRRGAFHCKYPVAPGTYELHLLFAETSGVLENSRIMAFSINGGQAATLDVVDDAGGDDIATTKVFTGVRPENDGSIHLDFTTPDSFLNGVEIFATSSSRMLPVRIVAGPSPYHDSGGNVWMPDRYFFGGRVNSFSRDLSRTVPDGRLFEWHRYGHFHYVVPVAAGAKYTLKLYFLEHWFGAQNGSVGGAGSRVFDVWCNGHTLLKDFDIFSETGTGPLVKTFNHIEPTPQGNIELYFMPAINYPSVSAIEVLAE